MKKIRPHRTLIVCYTMTTASRPTDRVSTWHRVAAASLLFDHLTLSVWYLLASCTCRSRNRWENYSISRHDDCEALIIFGIGPKTPSVNFGIDLTSVFLRRQGSMIRTESRGCVSCELWFTVRSRSTLHERWLPAGQS